jgi:hypothetical protein
MGDHSDIDHTGLTGVGGSSDLDAIIAASSGQDIADALDGAAAPDAGNVFATMADVGGGGGSDLVQVAAGAGSVRIPGLAGSPDIPLGGGNDNEFDTTVANGSAPTSWTVTANTPTTLDCNTTVKSHLYIAAASNASDKWWGMIRAAPSIPYTMTVKLTDHDIRQNYGGAGLAILDDSVGNGKASAFVFQCISGLLLVGSRWSTFIPGGGGNATYSAGIGSNVGVPRGPVYLRAIVSAANSIVFQYSHGGLIWVDFNSADGYLSNATYVAIVVDSQTASTKAAFDWVRFT